MATASARQRKSFEGSLNQGPTALYQQQITVRIVGQSHLCILKQTFTSCVIAAAMQLLDPSPHLRQARLQQTQRIAG